MTDGSGDTPPMPPAGNGGEFLLSLLQRPNHQPQPQPQTQPPPPPPHQQSHFPSQFPPFVSQQLENQNQSQIQHHHHHHPQQQQQPLALDPAVAAVGPSLPLLPYQLLQSDGHDFLSNSPPVWPHNLGFPPKHHAFPYHGDQIHGNQFHGNQFNQLADDLQGLGLSNVEVRGNSNSILHLVQQRQQLEQKVQFGSFSGGIQSPPESLGLGSRYPNGLERNWHFEQQVNPHLRNSELREPEDGGRGNQHQYKNQNQQLHQEQHQNYRSKPPGFYNKPRGGGGNWEYGSRKRESDYTVNREKGNYSESNNERARSSDGSVELGLTGQLDHPGQPAGTGLHSVLGLEIEESLVNLDSENGEDEKDDGQELDNLGEELVDTLLLEGEPGGKKDKKQRIKEFRSDNRGQKILSQRMRMLKRQVQCRVDIDRMNTGFLALYDSLIPLEEEKVKQKQFLALLEKLVNKEWPEARMYLYGSCANSFGVSKSDIDVCLAIEDAGLKKSEVLLKLADILQSDNLQNVQALTRARVPIVKLMDPVTGISCDICINNVLAVVNTKLLRDYVQIDVRLRQLAFIVKHWAKSRRVNATYQGTLSSYAYVLMCIHFLQQRRPAILPCLQEMATTYSIVVDDIRCEYFDQVEKLHGFGSRNKETISQLVRGFFNYWAYCHDYTNAVISVRTGSILSKRDKDWTRRIGNDRHLICIEDPFETSHDLGRVVDKFSIKVLREEFERGADIMQYDPDPCVTLFEPYIQA